LIENGYKRAKRAYGRKGKQYKWKPEEEAEQCVYEVGRQERGKSTEVVQPALLYIFSFFSAIRFSRY